MAYFEELTSWSLAKKLTVKIYELMQDNRDLCVQRILEIVGPKYSKIVNKNIVCADFFKWDFENWKPKEEVDETKIENK